MMDLNDGENWWKVERKYNSGVLIGNWLEDRQRGLPMHLFFGHHNEPRNRHLVSEYDDKYNRRGYNPLLPALRSWNGRKLSWIPQRPDFPICEPPTNYGLLEYRLKRRLKEDAELMMTVYTTTYRSPPLSAFVDSPLRQIAKAQYLLSNMGHLQSISQILDKAEAEKYLRSILQLRVRKALGISV